MRICFVAVALLASFASAVASQNPDVFVYVDFDPPNRVHRVDPQPYDIISAYLMIDCVPNGFRAICFAVHVQDTLVAVNPAVSCFVMLFVSYGFHPIVAANPLRGYINCVKGGSVRAPGT